MKRGGAPLGGGGAPPGGGGRPRGGGGGIDYIQQFDGPMKLVESHCWSRELRRLLTSGTIVFGMVSSEPFNHDESNRSIASGDVCRQRFRFIRYTRCSSCVCLLFVVCCC